MRLVFAGTPPFAARALDALHAAGHDIALVLTQPDRPSGRGLKLKPSSVAEMAGTLRLDIARPASLNTAEARMQIEAAAPDVMVVAAYGLILPQSVLAIPRKGCLNIHASLLPRWRGAAPIQRAILAGDAESGVAIMVMERGLDTGPIILVRRVMIAASDTAGTLTEKLSGLGAEAIVEALDRLDTLVPLPQGSTGITYATKIKRSEAELDWQLDAAVLNRLVRAFNPFPGAETRLDGEPLKVWESEPIEASGNPGKVIGHNRGRPVVGCGQGSLALTVIQRPGSRRMLAAEFLKGRPMPLGTWLGTTRRGSA